MFLPVFSIFASFPSYNMKPPGPFGSQGLRSKRKCVAILQPGPIMSHLSSMVLGSTTCDFGAVCGFGHALEPFMGFPKHLEVLPFITRKREHKKTSHLFSQIL